MTCRACASGFRYWFRDGCIRCRARRYVWVLFERERGDENRRIRAECNEAEQAEFQRYVEEERGKA